METPTANSTTSSTYQLADDRLRAKLGPEVTLAKWLVSQREGGNSFEHIARNLSRTVDVDVSRVTIGNWYKALPRD
jgi:hypothetical protein